MKKIQYILILIAAAASCSPPEVGYISANIHTVQDTIFVPRGIFNISATPIVEGSTYPISWEITGVTDTDGNTSNDLFQEHEITTWTSAYNPETDTTLELAKKKVKQSNEPSLLINDVTGELIFTQATKYVEKDIFHVHVKATNVKGSRQLDDFVVVKLEPFKAVEFPAGTYSKLILKETKGNKKKTLFAENLTNDFDDGVPSVVDGTHPYFTVIKLSEEPSQEIKVNMVITDSYDKPLNPEKVVFRPHNTEYAQNFHDNSVETVSDDIKTTFSLPAPPFPQYSRTHTNDEKSYFMFYFTAEDAFTVDKVAYEADNGLYDWTPYTDAETGEVKNYGDIRWGIKINDTGTWQVKMKIPYTKIKE